MHALTENLTETKLRQDLKTICLLAYNKGLVSGFDGSFSLKTSDNSILITPTNTHKGLLEEKDFILLDLNGNILTNGKEPSEHLSLHLAAYKARPDIKAFIHAHPPIVVSLTIAGIDFNQPIIPNTVISLGEVGFFPYTNSDKDTEESQLTEILKSHDAIILDKHGSITVGNDIFTAYENLEILEFTAKVLCQASQIGEVKTLSDKEIAELINERHKIYGKDLQDREKNNLFHDFTQKLTVKKLISKVLESESPVFQRVLSLTHELTINTIEKTSYSTKMSKEEKEQISRELTGSFFNMILGKFTRK
jgi:L-fuculose-phosphate aldolase